MNLQDSFDRGILVKPCAAEINWVDLANAWASLGGVKRPLTDNAQKIFRWVEHGDHHILIIVDGMGMNVLNRLPESSFLRQHLKTEIQSVFLSTTASALSSLFTCEWPAVHSVPGWWGYLPDHELSITCLPFIDRDTGESLTELGLTAEDVFPVPSQWGMMEQSLHYLVPAGLSETVFTHYSSGEDAVRTGYVDIDDAFQQVLAGIGDGPRGGLTHLYLPQLDTLEHELGPEHDQVLALLIEIDRKLEAFAAALPPSVRCIIAADHGQIANAMDKTVVLPPQDSLIRKLVCRPYGEPSVPMFLVKVGAEQSFYDEFTERFGQWFTLLTPDQIDEQRLSGPVPLSPMMRKRLGTYVGIAHTPARIFSEPCSPVTLRYGGSHGGLTAEEMVTPLIVI